MRKAILLIIIAPIVLSSVEIGHTAQLCSDIDVILSDTMSLSVTVAKPGDTFNLPISMKNRRNVAGWASYMEFDTTYVKPVFVRNDTLIVGPSGDRDTLVTPIYSHTTTSRVKPTSNVFIVVGAVIDNPSSDPDILRIKTVGIPDFEATVLRTAVDSGSGEFLNLQMVLKSNTPHNQQIPINFYAEDLYLEDSIPPIHLGCQHTQLTDTVGINVRPVVINRFVRADTSNIPTINSFTASPQTITQGQSTTLSWDVTDATSLELDPGDVDVTGTTSRVVTPSATTTYTLTATNASGDRTRSVTVTVNPVGSNNPPVVDAVVPSSYTISEGESVAFTVSASDTDGDNITLSALSLPPNASFGIGGSVTGVGSVQGNFSFTPNTGQAGTYQVQFQATDGIASSNTVTVTITVEEIEFDILFTTSTADGSPVGGLKGRNSILFPIDLVTSQTVYGVQFDMKYDAENFEVDSIITTGRTPDYVIYDDIGETPGKLRVVTFGMSNEPVTTDTTNNTAILYVVFTIDSTAVPGNYPVYLENGWESVDPDPSFPSLPLFTDSGIVQVDMLGDVNLDQHIDVADAVNIVGSILDNFTLTIRQFDAADLNTDISVNVLDLVGVINLIYGAPFLPAPAYSSELATVSLDYGDLFEGTSDVMTVRSELPEAVAGVELDIQYDPETVILGKPVPTEDVEGLKLLYKTTANGHMKILMHFTNPFDEDDLVRVGQADLVEIPVTARSDVEYGDDSQLRLTNVLLSTSAGKSIGVDGFGPALPSKFTLYQNYPNPFNPTTMIEFSLEGGSKGGIQDVSLDIYNILGQHVNNLVDEKLPIGFYQVEWRGQDTHGRAVATGVYLYRLQVDDATDSKKMLLLK